MPEAAGHGDSKHSTDAGVSLTPAHFPLVDIEYTQQGKEEMYLPATGYIQVHAYTSKANIPLKDVAVMITYPDGNAIAMRQTDRSGLIEPVSIIVPELSAGLTPDTGVVPYSTVNIYARLENYEQIEAENVQVFPDTVTLQNLEMIPLAELPERWTKAEIFKTPPQNL